MAGVCCRTVQLGLWVAICLRLSQLAHSSAPSAVEEKFAKLLEDGKGVLPSTLSREELSRHRELRNERAAELYKDSDKWADDPDVVKRANSFSQVQVSDIGEHHEDIAENASNMPSAHLNAGEKWSPFCEHVKIEGCGEKDWFIRRSKTARQMLKTLVNGMMFVSLLAAALAFSILTFGMFTAFFAPTSAAVSTGLIASCQTVMYTSVANALLGSTLDMTVGLGVTGGMLTQAISAQTGMSWSHVQNLQKDQQDFKWASAQEDTCNDIVFAGAYTMNLQGLELESNEAASDAIHDWCQVMGREDNFGRTLWHVEGVMPKTTTCKAVDKPDKEMAAKQPHKWFTCYDLLHMQSEEMTYQAGRVAFNLQRSTDDMDEYEDSKPCSEMLYTNSVGSTGIGALCKAIDKMRKGARVKQMKRLEGMHFHGSVLQKNATEVKEVRETKQKLRSMHQKVARALAKEVSQTRQELQSLLQVQETIWPFTSTPKEESKSPPTPPQKNASKTQGLPSSVGKDKKWGYLWTAQGSKWAGEKQFFKTAPKVDSVVSPEQLLGLQKKWHLETTDGSPETLTTNGYFKKEEVPWETAEIKTRISKVGSIPGPLKIIPELDKKAMEKHKKLTQDIKKTKDKLEKLEKEKADHLKANPGLVRPPTDFEVDDMADDFDDREIYALDVQGPATAGDVPPPLGDEENGDFYDLVSKMKQVEAQKAQAIHNCLATASCQILRKDFGQLKGNAEEGPSGMYKFSQHVMTSSTQRCLSHTALYGPADSQYCKPSLTKTGQR